MMRNGASPAQVASRVAQNPEMVSTIYKGLPEMAALLREFWGSVSDVGAWHLQDSTQLKATFAGDLFPGHTRNVVSTAGLYIDTVVLPCPFIRIAPLLNSTMPPERLVEMLLKHVLTAMTYRDVALAEVDLPIAVVLPNSGDLGVDGRTEVFERSHHAILKHAQYLFGREFGSVDHLAAFCGELATVDQVMNELKRPDRLLFATEWESRDPREQLIRAMREQSPQPRGMDTSVAGNHVLGTCLGRMPQAMAARENGSQVGGVPLIHAETSWLYYTWLLEYEAATLDVVQAEGVHVARALVAEREQNLDWLGNVPSQAVIDIRKSGLAEEVREILGNGVGDLVRTNPNNFFRTADRVVENIDLAFREHERLLAEARNKKLKLYGLDVPACLATGVIGVAAALTSNIPLGVASALLGVAGLPNLKDLKSRHGELAAEERKRRESPAGLLFRHLKR